MLLWFRILLHIKADLFVLIFFYFDWILWNFYHLFLNWKVGSASRFMMRHILIYQYFLNQKLYLNVIKSWQSFFINIFYLSEIFVEYEEHICKFYGGWSWILKKAELSIYSRYKYVFVSRRSGNEGINSDSAFKEKM